MLVVSAEKGHSEKIGYALFPNKWVMRMIRTPEHQYGLNRWFSLHPPEAKVWAYGSRINGTARLNPDLDVIEANHIVLL
jgi:hypothetical protein